ncbi:MAG TPA: amidase, partial [Cytophagales bacterium]|nr:amidase [Cytophagales bacterium]
DKVGPICRSAAGAAAVFDAIRGLDPKDPTLIAADFNYAPQVDLSQLRVGYFADFFEKRNRSPRDTEEEYQNDLQVLEALRKLGADLVPVKIETEIPVGALSFILTSESAASFDELTRSNEDELLVRQDSFAWPNTFRKNRFVPAVEYIQANRLRRLLAQEIHTLFQEYDVIVTPSFGGAQLLITNLTGQPVVVVPNGFRKNGTPTSISFLGNLY